MINNGPPEIIHGGQWLDFKERMVNGKNWEFVSRKNVKDIVCIVPFVANENIMLIKQYRPAIGKKIIEFPAGLVDKGETVIQAAKREMLEETGYELLKPHMFGVGYSSPGMTDENITLIFGNVGKDIRPAEEGISLMILHPYDIIQMIKKGKEKIDMRVVSFFLGGLSIDYKKEKGDVK